MKKIMVIIAVLVISGCKTVDQPRIAFRSNPFADCLAEIAVDPYYAELKEKIVIAPRSPSVEMLSNREKPTQEEKALILRWANARDRCFSSNTTTMKANTSEEHFEVMYDTFSRSKMLIAKLYSGEITYGDLAQAREALNQSERQAHRAINAVEESKRQVVADQQRQILLMQWQALQTKPAPAPAPQPYMIPTSPTVTTNCTTVAGQVNCTSR